MCENERRYSHIVSNENVCQRLLFLAMQGLCVYLLQFTCEEASVNSGVAESNQFSMPSVASSSKPFL